MDDLVPTGLPSGWDNIIQTSSGLGDVVSTGSSSALYDLIPSDTDSGSLLTPTMTLSVSVSSTMVANSSTTYISRKTKKHKTHHKYHGPKCPHVCARPTKSHHKSKPNCASMGTGISIRPTGRPHHKSHHKPYTTFSTTFPSSNSETASEEYPTAMASSSTNKPNKSKYYQSTVTPNPISLSNIPSEEYLTTTTLSRRYTVSHRGATLVTRRWDPHARMMKRYRVISSSRAKTSCSTTSASYSRKPKHTHKYKTHNSTLPSSTQSSKLPHPTTKSPKGISCRKTPGQTHQAYEPELKAALLSFCQNMTNPLPVITLYKPLQLLVPNITVTGTDILGTDSGSCALVTFGTSRQAPPSHRTSAATGWKFTQSECLSFTSAILECGKEKGGKLGFVGAKYEANGLWVEVEPALPVRCILRQQEMKRQKWKRQKGGPSSRVFGI